MRHRKKREEKSDGKKNGVGRESNPTLFCREHVFQKAKNLGANSPGGVASTCYRMRGAEHFDCRVV